MAKTPNFQYKKSTEQDYARQLRKLAAQASAIIMAHVNEDGEIDNVDAMVQAANLYAQAITPWAAKVAADMIKSVTASNRQDWINATKNLSKDLSYALTDSAIAPTVAQMQAEQVKLIKSIPTEAAERAKNLSQQAVLSGQRADEVASMIQDTEGVTKSRATLIARTEIAKTNSSITQARAQSVGVDNYIWRTMEDAAVRPSHAEMDDGVFSFSNPPYVDGEGNHGPGDFPNCRCYAEPIIT